MAKQIPKRFTDAVAAKQRKAAARKARDGAVRRSKRKAEMGRKGERSSLLKGGSRSLALDETRQEILAALRVNPVLTEACKTVNVTYSQLVHARNTDQAFADMVKQAQTEGWEQLESAAYKQALKNSEPGNNTHKLKEFLLKGRKREVYGDRIDVAQQHKHELVINLVPAVPPRPGGQDQKQFCADSAIQDAEFAEVAEGEEP